MENCSKIYNRISRKKIMKRYGILFLLAFLLILSACTLTIPDLINARIIKVEQDHANMSVYLRYGEEGYYVTVESEIYSCGMLADSADILLCSGPGFEPGQEVDLRFYKTPTDKKPLASLTFVVPDFPLEDSDNDGVLDAEDLCPANPLKTTPGECGCSGEEIDSDGDGTYDCADNCPLNPGKTKPDENGCVPGEKDSAPNGARLQDPGPRSPGHLCVQCTLLTKNLDLVKIL